MRKSLIRILILVIFFAVLYISASYYMGVQAERKLAALARSYNSDLIKVDVKTFDKGIFRSNAELEVQFEDYNKFNLNLELFHAPIFLYKDTENHTRLYFLKSLVNIMVVQNFLQEQVEIISNTSVIDILRPVNIDIRLTGLTKLVFAAFGLTSPNVENDDAFINIKLEPEKIIFLLSGKAVNQVSKKYYIDNSQYQLSLKLQKTKLDKLEPSKWQSKITANFLADTVKINQDEDVNKEIAILQPNVIIAYTGSIRNLLDLYAKKSLWLITSEIILADQYQDFSVEAKANKINYNNNLKDSINISLPSFAFSLRSFQDKIEFSNKAVMSNFTFTSKTDQLSSENLNFALDLGIDKDVLIDYDKDELVNLGDMISNVLNKTYETSSVPLEIKKNFAVNNLVGDGLLIGKLNLDNYNSELIITNDLKDKENQSTITYNANLEKFILKTEALNSNLDVYLKSLHTKNIFNISEYLNYLAGQSNDVYHIDLESKVDLPRIKWIANTSKVAILDFSYNFMFKLDPLMKGFLNSDSKLAVLNLGYNNESLLLNGLGYKSAMQQSYKHLLTGLNDFRIDKININYDNNILSLANFQVINKSDKVNNNLSYGNRIIADNINLNNNALGFIKYKDSYYNIKAQEYLDFITQASATNLEDLLKPQNVNEINLNNTQINQFLASGMTADNSIYLGQAKESIMLINSLKVKPKFKSNSKKTADDRYDILSQLQLNTSLVLSKNYTDKLIELTNNEQVKEQYLTWQKVGLIDFRNNIAKINIIYDHNQLTLNGSLLENWKAKYELVEDAKKSSTSVEPVEPVGLDSGKKNQKKDLNNTLINRNGKLPDKTKIIEH